LTPAFLGDQQMPGIHVEEDFVCRSCQVRWAEFKLDNEEEVRKD